MWNNGEQTLKASELLEFLQKDIAENGDRPVFIEIHKGFYIDSHTIDDITESLGWGESNLQLVSVEKTYADGWADFYAAEEAEEYIGAGSD